MSSENNTKGSVAQNGADKSDLYKVELEVVPKFDSQKHILDDVLLYLKNKNSPEYMPDSFSTIQFLFTQAVQTNPNFKLDPITAVIGVPTKEAFGDFQCNDSMRVSKSLQSNNISLPSTEVAKFIVNNLPENDIIGKVDIVGRGFINVWLKDEYIKKGIENIVLNGVKPPAVIPKRIVVDFSSPNIAKEMHVGHLRSTILGETICRVFEFCGMDVLRINHVGDWGTQFGMLIAQLSDKFPNYESEMPMISDLQTFYKESKKRFDLEPDFKKISHDNVVLLQSGDAKIRKAWGIICELSRREFQKIYDRLDITLQEIGESFYQDRMDKVLEQLEEKGVISVEDGCKVVHLKTDTVPLLLQKSDGAYTYDTSDVATLKYRLFEQKADWVIYVVDIGQRLHFLKFFELGYNLGWYNPSVNRVEHIGFGVILGDDNKKFKTRAGKTIRLIDLLDEGVKKSESVTRSKPGVEALSEEEIKQISEAKGYGCIRYNDMVHSLTNDYKFSFERMLDERGNTAVYLLYAFTRVRSILRNSGLTDEAIKDYVSKNGIKLSHEAEIKLAKKLIAFSDTVHKVVYDTYPHYLCEYVYSLSGTLTNFYDKCICIEKNQSTGEIVNVNFDRISLIYASSLVFLKGFYLLGIRPVEKM